NFALHDGLRWLRTVWDGLEAGEGMAVVHALYRTGAIVTSPPRQPSRSTSGQVRKPRRSFVRQIRISWKWRRAQPIAIMSGRKPRLGAPQARAISIGRGVLAPPPPAER